MAFFAPGAFTLVSLVAALVLLVGSPASAGKVRRMRSKGVTYVLDLKRKGEETVTLVIDPGKDAWLAAAWGAQSHGVVRMGHGLKWMCVGDTRRNSVRAELYLEAEPLAGKEFKEASAAYPQRLPDLWRHVGQGLDGEVKPKRGKRLRIGKLRLPTMEYKMALKRASDGVATPAFTILFPLAGHLVALTSVGGSEYAKQALRALRVTTPGEDVEPRVCHSTDTVERTTTYLALTPPAGYRMEAVVPGEDDATLVARWRRAEPGGTPGSLTLTRFSLAIDKSAAAAVTRWASFFDARGDGETDAPVALSVDGEDASSIVYRRRKKDADPTAWGWFVMWRSGTTVYGLQGETSSKEAATASAAEFALVAKKILAWRVP